MASLELAPPLHFSSTSSPPVSTLTEGTPSQLFYGYERPCFKDFVERMLDQRGRWACPPPAPWDEIPSPAATPSSRISLNVYMNGHILTVYGGWNRRLLPGEIF